MSLPSLIVPRAFKGCTELKTLYFKDTDANNYNAKTEFDFFIGDSAFADCPNLTEVKMMQYTTRGDNHWEALKPEQVSRVASNVFDGSPNLKTIIVRSATPAKLTGKDQFQKNDGLKIYVQI